MQEQDVRFRPVRCERCSCQDFLRKVAYSNNGKVIEEWFSDAVIECARCGFPLHHNKEIIDNRDNLRIPLLTETIEDMKDKNEDKKSFDWFAGKQRISKN